MGDDVLPANLPRSADPEELSSNLRPPAADLEELSSNLRPPSADPEEFLYLTTIGRRSGLPRRIEIWFVVHDGAHYVVSEGRDRAGWVKNLTKNPAVRFSVGRRGDEESVRPLASAVARSVDPGEEPALARAVSAAMDAKYGWSDGLIVELRS